MADAPAPAPLPIPDGGAPPSLTLDERAAIVTSALDLALVEKAIPDYGLLKDPKNVVLSDANLAGLAPKVGGGVRLQVMSPDAIQSKADREGDFLFLELGPMAEDANGAIVVSLRNAWALSAASKKAGKIIMSGGGFALRFRRDGAGWKREVVMKWIS